MLCYYVTSGLHKRCQVPLSVVNLWREGWHSSTKHVITVGALYIGVPRYVTLLLQDSKRCRVPLRRVVNV